MKKVLWTLNVDNYEPEIAKITFPYLKNYARKCKAEFCVIEKRAFPEWPVTYEKMQIYNLGKDNDWNIYIDADTIVHPDFFDVTCQMNPYEVAHNANDIAGNRWIYDRFMLRDGRNIGSCNWFAIASKYCIELWKPLDDMTLNEALANIRPTVNERASFVWQCQNKMANGQIQCGYEIPTTGNGDMTCECTPGNATMPPRLCQVHRCTRCGGQRIKVEKAKITPEHLIDDYTLSRNIAKYGLKFTTVRQIQERLGDRAFYLWHIYTLTTADKIKQMREVMIGWGLV